MSAIRQNVDLFEHNTFGIHARASRFATVESIVELEDLLERREMGMANDPGGDPAIGPEGSRVRLTPLPMVLGGGSNVLFSGDFRGLVIHPAFRGTEVLEENRKSVLVRVGAGENWDSWVAHSLQRGWSGLENLSLIPGSVGAAPIQNIGAYGVEVSDHVAWVDAYDLEKKECVRLTAGECCFGYRDSLFKSEARDRYLVTHVGFRLSLNPELKLGYGNVKEKFRHRGGKTPLDLRNTIIDIRREKLPSPEEFANAGSFFKNPVVESARFNHLRTGHGQVPNFPLDENRVKIPAAWLIEKAGWKEKRLGRVGTWPVQPLVIVNYGGATGSEVLDFSERIRSDVHRIFGIGLEREVTVV